MPGIQVFDVLSSYRCDEPVQIVDRLGGEGDSFSHIRRDSAEGAAIWFSDTLNANCSSAVR